MKLSNTHYRIASAIQMFDIDGISYSNSDLARACGVTTKTITRNKDLISMIEFTLNIGGYNTCIIIM